MLVALDEASMSLHNKEVKKGGIIVHDSKVKASTAAYAQIIGVPLNKLAMESAGNALMENTVALGAILGLLQFDFYILTAVLYEHFGKENIGKENVKAAQAGYGYIETNAVRPASHRSRKIADGTRMMLNGK